MQCAWFSLPGLENGKGWRGKKMKEKNPFFIMAEDEVYWPWKVLWQRYLQLPENTCAPQISQPPFARWGHVTSSEKWAVSRSCICDLWVEALKGQHLTLWLSLSLLWQPGGHVCCGSWRNRLEPELPLGGELSWRDTGPAADFTQLEIKLCGWATETLRVNFFLQYNLIILANTARKLLASSTELLKM